jgi:hypothetical protein
MGLDDDASCVEHIWRFTEALADDFGLQMEYECSRCGALSVEVKRSGPARA